MANVIRVHENADMRSDLAALGDDAIAERSVMPPQQRQRFSHRGGRSSQLDTARAAGKVGKESGNLNGDQATPALF